MRMILKFLPTLLMLALMVGAEACSDANAAPPTGDYRRIDQKTYFSKDVSVDGTFTASGLDCSATRSWTGGTISLNASSNFAVNVGTGTSTGTVTLGGTGTQAIAIGDGAGAKTVTLGSATGASATTISGGSADVTINSADDFFFTATDDITITSGSTAGILNLATGAFAQVVNIATNALGNTVNIGTDNSVADTINIGSALDTTTIAGKIAVSSTTVAGTAVLNAGSPATATATVRAGSICTCSIVGATAAIAAKGCAVSLASTTLTITSANAAGENVNYHCF